MRGELAQQGIEAREQRELVVLAASAPPALQQIGDVPRVVHPPILARPAQIATRSTPAWPALVPKRA
jgi:hypothetical protein